VFAAAVQFMKSGAVPFLEKFHIPFLQ